LVACQKPAAYPFLRATRNEVVFLDEDCLSASEEAGLGLFERTDESVRKAMASALADSSRERTGGARDCLLGRASLRGA
jgi:hypothetical protein